MGDWCGSYPTPNDRKHGCAIGVPGVVWNYGLRLWRKEFVRLIDWGRLMGDPFMRFGQHNNRQASQFPYTQSVGFGALTLEINVTAADKYKSDKRIPSHKFYKLAAHAGGG